MNRKHCCKTWPKTKQSSNSSHTQTHKAATLQMTAQVTHTSLRLLLLPALSFPAADSGRGREPFKLSLPSHLRHSRWWRSSDVFSLMPQVLRAGLLGLCQPPFAVERHGLKGINGSYLERGDLYFSTAAESKSW